MVKPLPFIDRFFGAYAGVVTQAIYFVISFLVIYIIGKLVVLPLIDRALKKRGLKEYAKKPILKISRFAVLFIAVAVAFGVAGFGNFLTAFATIAAAGTLAIGFAMKDIIGNFVSGIFIYIEKPFVIGDWIEWDGNSGVVEDIELRVTRVRTFDNELLTVPNSQLTNRVVKNPVAKDKLRVKFLFGISYEDDINKATEIILKKANENEQIMDDPEPSVVVTELADSYIGLQSRIWIEDPSRADFMNIRSEFVQDVKERFDEEDIEIPFPQVDLSGKVETGGKKV
ncbi:MAG: mechanosensitive ion channel family protein [Candidatus Thermoplasmatota archaeon]|nr:mechanosensitive ion channel family protein [Candidatus Thermoplasmatota archaeon]